MRTVIFHVHLFKNAGTSVDAVLKRNFPDGWVTREFDGGREANAAGVAAWVAETPAASAYSSHTAMLPLPEVPDTRLIPMVFVRHPLDRIYSAYRFEVTQKVDGFGAELAKVTDFAGYVRVRLALPGDFAIRDFQARRLCGRPGLAGAALGEAAAAAAASLPFLSLVERFDASMARFAELVRPHFPDFAVASAHANAGRGAGQSLEERLAEIRAALGDALYERLAAENAQDLALYELICRRYA